MNLANHDDRLRIIESVKSENTLARKQYSFRQFEVMGGRIQQFVKENLEGQLNADTVREMPIVSSINVQKAVCDAKATVYKKAPERSFTDVSDEQAEKLGLVYRDMKLNSKLNQVNKSYTYQDQSIGMIIPKNGKLIARTFIMHQIDAIPDLDDPESASGFIISAFDRELYEQIDSDRKEKDVATGRQGRSVRSTANPDGDHDLADKYQYKLYIERYLIWTPEYNFIMNGFGNVIDPLTGEESNESEIISPLASEGVMPFFEISRDKDFEFFVRPSNALTDFTIQFNERLSDLANVQKLNGYAVAILKTPSDMKPNNLIIGASQIIHLATDDDREVSFEFASPSSNISEISESNDKFLNYFVTSEGLSGDVVNSTGASEKTTSGIDRFIQGVQKIEAHADDYDRFRCLEDDIYKIIKAWMRVLNGTTTLDKKYQCGDLGESAIEVKFHKPEMIQTESELLSNIATKLDLRLISREDAIGQIHQLKDVDKINEIIKKIDDSDLKFDLIEKKEKVIEEDDMEDEGIDGK